MPVMAKTFLEEFPERVPITRWGHMDRQPKVCNPVKQMSLPRLRNSGSLGRISAYDGTASMTSGTSLRRGGSIRKVAVVSKDHADPCYEQPAGKPGGVAAAA